MFVFVKLGIHKGLSRIFLKNVRSVPCYRDTDYNGMWFGSNRAMSY